MPDPSAFEVELAIEKLKSHKSPGIDQIPAELIKAGGMTIRCAIHKLIISISNKKDKTDCNNYRGISLLPNTYKILSNILLSGLIQYAEEVIGYHQCGFRRNRSTTDHVFCIRQILEEKWGHHEAAHHLLIEFKKACDSVRREVLYNLIEFGIPKKLVRLITKCLF